MKAITLIIFVVLCNSNKNKICTTKMSVIVVKSSEFAGIK